jgi:O-acetyl-ADP-ribose deacetylase (regulator of RNase III)
MCGNANSNGWWFRQAKTGVALSNADGALHKSAGNGLQQECNALSAISDDGVKLRVGMARITSGHNLVAAHVIHTLGPSSYKGVQSTDELQRSYTACLEQTRKLKVKTLALPAVSCGVFSFPADVGAAAAFAALEGWVVSVDSMGGWGGDDSPDDSTQQLPLERIDFMLYDEATFCAFVDAAYLRWPRS